MAPDDATPAGPRLSPELLLVLATAGQTQKFPAGSIVFREGSVAQGFYLIVSGQADIGQMDGRGKPVRIAKLGPGDYFGEIGLLTEELRSAGVWAATELEVVVLDREQFQRIVAMSEPTAAQLEEVMKERLGHDPDM